MRVRGACLFAVALGTLAIGAGVAEAKLRFGVVPQSGPLPSTHDLTLMPRGGISMIRLTLHWASIEGPQGTYNWTGADAMIRKATRHGIQPLLLLFGSPDWAAHADGSSCDPSECAIHAPSSPATREAFADFAAAAVKRYGPNGDFWRQPDPPCLCKVAHPIRTWQVWNEQNSPKYYAPRVEPQSYAQTVLAAGTAIKGVDTGADVVLGGMWGPKSADEVMPVRPYLERLYEVPGIGASFDSIAIHPYGKTAKRSLSAVQAARGTLRLVGDPGAGVWITEIGWASGGPPENPLVKNERGQARLLRKTLSTLKHKRRTFHLRGVFWYSWRDIAGGSSICEWCAHAGLRARDGSPKPAWRAFAKVARR